MAGSRAEIVPRGLDWQEPQPVPSHSPGWVWQLSGLRWFRPPTRSTAQESGTQAARWAGLQGEGRAGTATTGAESARGWQVQERRGGAELGRVTESQSDLSPPSQGLGEVDLQ